MYWGMPLLDHPLLAKMILETTDDKREIVAVCMQEKILAFRPVPGAQVVGNRQK